jgi:cation transport ATPase
VIFQWIFFSLLLIGVNSINCTYAEDSSQDWYKNAEIQNHEFQLQLEKSELELKKMELEQSKLDTEHKQIEAEQLRILNEASDKEQELNEILEQAELALQEHEDAAKEAEEAADEARSLIEQAEVRQKNRFYLGAFILTITIFVWSVVKKYKQEGIMKDYEKYGVIIIIISTLLILFALMISEPWIERFDFVQNLMTVLRISIFPEEEDCSDRCTYIIDFPTKYAVLVLFTSAAYGFTTYLGITPAYKISELNISDNKEGG